MKQRIHLILLIVIGFVIYANALQNDFVYDDHVLVLDNNLIKNWKYLSKIFTTSLPAGANEQSNFYRPIQTLTYLINHSLFDLKPLGYHLTNIIFHIANAMLVFLLINRLTNNLNLSTITSLLFIVHPIQTEAVTYISGRADLLALFFMLLSLLLFGNYYWASISFFILALLSKEIVVVFPFILIVCGHHFLNKEKRTAQKSRYFAYFIVLAAYVFLRLTILKFSTEPQAAAEVNLHLRLLNTLKALLIYLRLLFLPIGLHMERTIKVAVSFLEPQVLVSAILVISLIAYMIKIKNSAKIISFGLFWFFINLIPVSNVVPLNAYLAEHWLYNPSMGFFLALAVGADKLLCLEKPIFKKTVILSFVFILSFYSVLTIVRNIDWKDNLTFFMQTLKYNPKSPRIHYNLAVWYERQGLLNKALEEYNLTIKLRPKDFEAYFGIGNIYSKEGKIEEALRQYQRALEINPYFADGYNNLGYAYYRKRELDKAIEAFNIAIKINPDITKYHNNLGAAYADKKLFREAKAAWQKALELDPNNSAARENLMRLQKLGY